MTKPEIVHSLLKLIGEVGASPEIMVKTLAWELDRLYSSVFTLAVSPDHHCYFEIRGKKQTIRYSDKN